MGWHTGTADNYKDLLAKIVATAVADGWTQERYTTGEVPPQGFLTTSDEAILRGPGFGAGYETWVGIRTKEVAPSNIFCLEWRGMTAYDASKIFEQQPGITPAGTHTNVWNTPIVYWLSISDRRILLIAKCSNTYHSAYAGLILPFSSPVEYPAPIYVAADSATPLPFGNIDSDTRGMNAPGQGGGWIRTPSGVWQWVCVYSPANYDYFKSWDAAQYTVYPYAGTIGPFGDRPGTDASVPPSARFEPINGQPGSMPIMPTMIQALFDRGGFIGSLEGIFWIPGNTFSTEQEITNSTDTYRVFIQISRSYEAPSPYYAVREA